MTATNTMIKMGLDWGLGRIRTFDCGHKWLVFFDTATVAVVGMEECLLFKGTCLANRKHCPGCLVDMAIQCWSCGKLILPFDPVVLYPVHDIKSPAIHPEDITYDDRSGQAISCCRCSEGGSDDADGTWAPPGKVDFDRIPLNL